VGIGAGAVVTAAAIAAMVMSTGPTLGGTGILTLDQLGTVDIPTTTPSSATLAMHDNGCFYLSLEERTAWAVWPAGTTRDADQLVLPDGTRLGDGDPLNGSVALVRKLDVDALVGDGGPAGLAQLCVGEDGDVALLTNIS
jgi:hypothetical protein